MCKIYQVLYVYNCICNAGYLYIIVFDPQFYIRLLWCVTLSAITNLAPRERRGVTAASERDAGLTQGYQG